MGQQEIVSWQVTENFREAIQVRYEMDVMKGGMTIMNHLEVGAKVLVYEDYPGQNESWVVIGIRA